MKTLDQLIAHMQQEGVLKTPKIIKAFETIDRADFVLPEYRADAYEDLPLPIGFHQTISQPSTVAFMLEFLNPKHGEKVLDIGSGSGWTTALLAHLVGKQGQVIGLEVIPELVKLGQMNLSKYNFTHAEIRPAGIIVGIPDGQFNKILVSASVQALPEELYDQIKLGGRLVIPVRESVWHIEKSKKGIIRKKEYTGFLFVPLLV